METASCYTYSEGIDLASVRFADCFIDGGNGYAVSPIPIIEDEIVSVAAGTTPVMDMTTDTIPITTNLPATTAPATEPAPINKTVLWIGGGLLLWYLMKKR